MKELVSLIDEFQLAQILDDHIINPLYQIVSDGEFSLKKRQDINIKRMKKLLDEVLAKYGNGNSLSVDNVKSVQISDLEQQKTGKRAKYIVDNNLHLVNQEHQDKFIETRECIEVFFKRIQEVLLSSRSQLKEVMLHSNNLNVIEAIVQNMSQLCELSILLSYETRFLKKGEKKKDAKLIRELAAANIHSPIIGNSTDFFDQWLVLSDGK